MIDWKKQLDQVKTSEKSKDSTSSKRVMSKEDQKHLDSLIEKALEEARLWRLKHDEILIEFLQSKKIPISDIEFKVYLALMKNYWDTKESHCVTMTSLCSALEYLAEKNSKFEKQGIKKTLQALRDRGHVEYVDPLGWRLIGEAVELLKNKKDFEEEQEWLKWSEKTHT